MRSTVVVSPCGNPIRMTRQGGAPVTPRTAEPSAFHLRVPKTTRFLSAIRNLLVSLVDTTHSPDDPPRAHVTATCRPSGEHAGRYIHPIESLAANGRSA